MNFHKENMMESGVDPRINESYDINFLDEHDC